MAACSEGLVFLVPMTDGGHVRGVVARTSPSGEVAFGYFFGPRIGEAAAATTDGLAPADAVLRARFDPRPITEGEWPVIGAVAPWDRSQWPMGQFLRRDAAGHVRVRAYAEDDPALLLSERAGDSAANLLIDYAPRPLTLRIALGAVLPADRGPIIPRTPKPEKERVDPNYAQAVFIHLRLSDDPEELAEDRADTWDLQEEIDDLLKKQDIGLLDGDEWGLNSQGFYDCVLYLYGRDARRLYQAIEPILKATPVAEGGHAFIRCGDIGAPEERVTWS